MSGGVDSAVATALAVRSGVQAVGVTMRLWSPGEGELSEKVRQCCGPTAYEDARRAAGAAGIPHYVVNFEAAFQAAVVDYFAAEYLAGRTPNPCVACNNLVKFGVLLDFAKALGASTVISGHYVTILTRDDGPHLLRAVDRSKDQSYMLAGLARERLGSIVTPLGAYTKEATRALAAEFALGVAEKPDSMDLCFVDSDYRGFIRRRYPESMAPGPVMTTDGSVVGHHDGLLDYTVGQRKGIAAAGMGDGPWYVVRTDRAANAVVIGRRDELARHAVVCSAPNVIVSRAFDTGTARGLAVCRYRSAPVPASARLLDDGRLLVNFDAPVSVVSPGQLLVLYDASDREVLASGIIEPDDATGLAVAS
ncbi:MAG: tRNA 2-thiouridine(34) synthase MnmA [Candidatus Eremiobacteraeota bacterium]|nr:tRNA 2-thiouridine(34) synthase MnmA [Candidatus Eremiobacteraeota bacterium]